MKRDNRQILINPHSSQAKVPVGALNLGEIGVQHNNVEDAALYVETVEDSESAETVAKFITEKAIDTKIENAIDVVQMEIESLNEEIGLPHDPELWNSGMSVWDAIEYTYAEMSAGTAAASTKLELLGGKDDYLNLTSEKDESTSSITYYLSSKNISEAIESAYTIVNEKIETLSGDVIEYVNEFSSATVERIENVEEKIDELSAATLDALADLDFTGVTAEGKPVVNVTQEDGLVNAETGTIDAHYVTVGTGNTPMDEVLEDIIDEIDANAVESADKTVVVNTTDEGTDLSVNIDGTTLVKDANGVISTDLKLLKETENLDANVREQYKLVYGDSTTAIGDVVKIYKDSSLHHAELGTMGDELVSDDDPTIVRGTGDTALDLVYHKEDGTYELVKIDVNDFLEESEFQDGLEVDNHVVKVKIADNSEELVVGDSGVTAPVLTVDENGVKVDNIQAAIDYAVAELAGNIDADVTGTSEDGHVTVEVVQESTELTQVVVTTEDIASAEELDNVEEAVGLNEDGTFTPDSASTFASAATSVRNEIQLIDQALKEVADKLNGTSVSEGESVENFVTLDVTDDGEGATAITINDSELKQAIDFIHDDITTEIAAREDAIAEVIGTSASTSAETSLMGIKELISNLATTLVKDVTVPTGETLIEVTKEDTPEGDLYTISSTEKLVEAVELAEASVQEVGFAAVAEKDETVYGSNAGAEIVDGNDGKKLVLDLSVLKLDCGEY